MVLLYMMTEWLDWMKLLFGFWIFWIREGEMEGGEEDEGKVSVERWKEKGRRRRKIEEEERKKKLSNLYLPHAAHVRGQVEHLVASRDDLLAVVVDAEVDEVELVAELLLLFFVCSEVFELEGEEEEGGRRRGSERSREKGNEREVGRAAAGNKISIRPAPPSNGASWRLVLPPSDRPERASTTRGTRPIGIEAEGASARSNAGGAWLAGAVLFLLSLSRLSAEIRELSLSMPAPRSARTMARSRRSFCSISSR